jgi:hypothetical protein
MQDESLHDTFLELIAENASLNNSSALMNLGVRLSNVSIQSPECIIEESPKDQNTELIIQYFKKKSK